ncbi:hypothetical protein FQN49_008694, partial [Arthroderma sp. PD_2]
MPETLESQLPLPPSSPPTISPTPQPPVDEGAEEQEYDSSSLLPPLPTHDDDDLNEDSTNDYRDDYARDDSQLAALDTSMIAALGYEDHDASLNRTMNEEQEMHRKLMDMESSFLPEPSTLHVGGATTGVDDTYLVGVDAPETPREVDENKSRSHLVSPETPSDAYKTPAPSRTVDLLEPSLMKDEKQTLDGDSLVGINTSSLETISSPPTAAAAARTISRVLSAASSRSGRYGESTREEVREQEHGQEHTYEDEESHTEQEGDFETTPRKSRTQPRSQSPPHSRSLQDSSYTDNDANRTSETQGATDSIADQQRTRPKFLVSRQSSHRLSTSSITTANTDGALSDATMGMDYALQSGGALPSNSVRAPQSHGRKMDLSRSISLGSMASGISNLSDDHPYERRVFSGVSE